MPDSVSRQRGDGDEHVNGQDDNGDHQPDHRCHGQRQQGVECFGGAEERPHRDGEEQRSDEEVPDVVVRLAGVSGVCAAKGGDAVAESHFPPFRRRQGRR